MTRMLAFRVCFVALLLVTLPEPWSFIPYVGDVLVSAFDAVWSAIVPGAARLSGVGDVAGHRGDSLGAWVKHGVIVVVSVVIALAWTLRARDRAHPRLHAWLRLHVRLALATSMIAYGATKAIPVQFGELSPERLVQPIGELSPMGLLWTFMSFSPAYTIFGGLLELLCAFLLAFRRTTTLGAILSLAVMTNVVLLNLSYDVPVKLGSSALLLLAAFLVAPDARRLVDLFVLDRATAPSSQTPLTSSPRLDRAIDIAVPVLLTAALLFTATQQWSRWTERQLPPHELVGAFDVERFERAGVEATDGAAWSLFGGGRSSAAITTRDGGRTRYRVVWEPSARTATLTPYEGGHPITLRSTVVAPDLVDIQCDTFRATLRRRDLSHSRLITRGFRWVSDGPYNR